MNETGRVTGRLAVLMGGPGSPSEVQLPWAVLLCGSLGVPLKLFHVADPAKVNEPIEVALAIASDYLELVASSLPPELAVETVVRQGLVQEEWRRLWEEDRRALLMIPSERHNPLASLLQGGAADDFVNPLVAPLVIVPPDGFAAPARLSRVVVGTDREAHSEAILALAKSLGGPGNVEIIEAEILEPGDLPEFDLMRQQPEISRERVRLRGKAGPMLLAVARVRDAQVILVGARSKHGPLPSRLGGTAAWLASHSDRPVVLIPEGWGSEIAAHREPQ